MPVRNSANFALKRGAYTTLGYKAAQYTRTTGQSIGPMNAGADIHLISDRDTLVNQSQAFYRDNGLYRGIVGRLVDNVLGNGLTLQAKTANAKTNTRLERKWKQFWCKPEIRGVFTGRKCERLAVAGLLVDGDFGTIKTNAGRIQLTESNLIYTTDQSHGKNLIVQGVEVDGDGAPVNYYVSRYDRFGNRRIGARAIPAADFVYMANIDRPSQTRGVPAMVASFPNFHRINDVCDSEAVAWQLLSKLAISITKRAETTLANKLSEEDPNRPNATAKELSLRVQQIDDGTIFHADDENAEIKGIDRNIPGPNFTASMTMYLRLLGLPIGCPLELLLLDWSKTNYSSARAALEQFFLMILGWQEQVKNWESDIYEWQLQTWIDAGEFKETDDVFDHDWIAPTSPWVDQLKESQAQGEMIDRSLTTHAEACKAVNRDRTELIEVRTREIEDAITRAERLNKDHPGANVDWRIFAGLLPLGAVAHAATVDAGAPPDNPSPEDQPTDPTPAKKGAKRAK